jgi:hypothetical protein
VVHAEKAGELDAGVDLLAAFAYRCARRVFVVVDESTGEAPQAVAGLDAPPAQHDSAVALDDDRGRHLRITPQDEIVVGACLDLVALDDLDDERRAAIDAEVHHRGRL